MTRVDFHFNVPDKVDYGCRLVRKAFRAGHRIVVFSDDAALLARFDQSLWTFSAHDFIPHVMATDPLASETAVLLTQGELQPAVHADDRDLMVNLGSMTPPGFARFERLIELVSGIDEDRAAGRERWRFYRDRGYPIETHDLAGAGQ
jgi:DNA polymerase-3 subunit chi